MFIELTTRENIKFLLNIRCIEQVAKDGERGSIIYVQNDEFSPYIIKESYEYIRSILLNR
jgi:hypothetical protein